MSAPPLALSSLPLFPLATVVFPGGVLPLRIFELRYLDMIGRCHRNGAPFGVVALQEGREVRAAGAAPERFADVGTFGLIESLERPQAGLLLIRCRGQQRFRIERRKQLPNGLWVADVVHLPADAATAVPHDLQPVAQMLRRVFESLRQRAAAAGEAAPLLPTPEQYDDCGWVANRWAELLPLPQHLKQQLMSLDSPLVRLELVADVVQRMFPAA